MQENRAQARAIEAVTIKVTDTVQKAKTKRSAKNSKAEHTNANMCHNSGIESEQIERYMAFGLPQRAVRSVKYTMRKREKQQRKELQNQQQQQSQNNSDAEDMGSSNSSNSNSDSCTDADIKHTCIVQLKKEKLTATEIVTDTAEAKATESAEIVIATVETIVTAIPNIGSSNNNNTNNLSDILKIPKFCGRFRKMQQQQQESEANSSAQSSPIAKTAATALTVQQKRKPSSMEPSMDDALAIGTQMTRKFAERCHCLIGQLQGSRLYT